MKVFTNGCFDILHPGHIDLLTRAKAMGDRLIVGINSDASTRAIKGVGRPLMTQDERRSVFGELVVRLVPPGRSNLARKPSSSVTSRINALAGDG